MLQAAQPLVLQGAAIVFVRAVRRTVSSIRSILSVTTPCPLRRGVIESIRILLLSYILLFLFLNLDGVDIDRLQIRVKVYGLRI
jgi:hypothetical protein